MTKRAIEALQKTLDDKLGEPVIIMRARRGMPDTVVTFNLGLRYLEVLRDILITLLRKPWDPPATGLGAKHRSKVTRKMGGGGPIGTADRRFQGATRRPRRGSTTP
jgi:hypothetical protein